MILEPPYSGWLRTGVTPLTETIKLVSIGLLPAQIRDLFGFSLGSAREALLRSACCSCGLGSRFWIDVARLHPAARAAAGERYGSLAE